MSGVLLEEEGNNRITIFTYIDFFENYIRRLITNELKSYYRKWFIENYKEKHREEPRKIPKDGWWKDERLVPRDVRDHCEGRRDEEIAKGKPEEPLMFNYADFSHYSRIIAKKHNWKNIFKFCFEGKEDKDVEVELNKLKEFRDPSHHHRTVFKDDVEWAKLCILDLCVDKEAKDEFKRLVARLKKTQIEPQFDKSASFEVKAPDELALTKEIIKRLEEEYGEEVPIEEVLDFAEEEGMEREKAEDIIEVMKRDGILFAPGSGVIKFVR